MKSTSSKLSDFPKKLQRFLFLVLAVIIPVMIIGVKLNEDATKLIGDIPAQKIFEKPVPKLPWLHTDGVDVVNESGKKVILRGVNIGSIDWGYSDWHQMAIKEAAQNWNAKVIRIRVIQNDYEKDPQAFFDVLEKEFLAPARQNQVYVIIHPRVPSSRTDLPDLGTIAMWQAIAAKYHDDPTVLYDLLAEPHGISAATAASAYPPLIEAVRQQSPNSLIFVTGIDWGRQINYYSEHPMPYANIIYRSNPYDKEEAFDFLFGQIEKTAPVFFGEFGANGFPKVTLKDTQALIDHAQRFGIGWTAWNFHSTGCPCLLKDYRDFSPSSYGEIVKTALQSQ